MSRSNDPQKDKYTEEPEFMDEEGDAMAFGIGLGHGFDQISPKPRATEATKRNKFYYYPGFVLGYILKAVVLALMAFSGVGGV